ncbi:MAG: radical SAM protein [Bacillota bacterium]|nr:radical SAM protein [Bacillota bacterium]MDI3317480.1 radical SAM protein [Bacillota bacterium]
MPEAMNGRSWWSQAELAVARRTAEAAVDAAVSYLMPDPAGRLDRILDTVERFVRDPGVREQFLAFRRRVSGDPAIAERARQLLTNRTMVKRIVTNWAIHQLLFAPSQRRAAEQRHGVHVPVFLLIDPTSGCNLRCKGCWAGGYARGPFIPRERFDLLLREAKELGIYWFVLSGGEPFAYKPLLDVVAEHTDASFMVYTNGTLITDRVADRLAELGNLSPAISLEGWREETDDRRGPGVFDRVMAAMDRLRERGVLFGASITVTRRNVEEVFSDDFISFLIEKGVVYLWSFHYVPVGPDADLDLMLRPEQRAWLVRRVNELRRTRPILIADFWNDGHFTQGCIAGARTYLHITPSGEAEPCAFVHFATHNIRESSLLEILRSPLFAAYQRRIPFSPNHYAPCPIIDNPAALRAMVAESGAHPTHPGAEDVLVGERARFLDELSSRWHAAADVLEAEDAQERGYAAREPWKEAREEATRQAAAPALHDPRSGRRR